MTGDVDLSRAGELIADRARSRILIALTAGRELSASQLAEEAGVSRPTASAHLKKLTEGRLIAVRAEGKSRHYRLAGPAVFEVLERLMELAPPEPITSLRDSTRAAQLRRARSCYDHLAGQLGVGLMQSMLDRGFLRGGDGRYYPDRDGADRPSAYGRDVDYQLTSSGQGFLDDLGARLPGGRRPLVRYCVDWTETRHHLAGQLGRALRDHALAAGWVEQRPRSRALRITPDGAAGIEETFGLALEAG
jgi:DNA-binding transcriptional ArsR family regulator